MLGRLPYEVAESAPLKEGQPRATGVRFSDVSASAPMADKTGVHQFLGCLNLGCLKKIA